MTTTKAINFSIILSLIYLTHLYAQDMNTPSKEETNYIGLATGPMNSSYMNIGKTLSKIWEDKNILIYTTNGGVQNINLLINNNKINFAIIQYDTLLLESYKHGSSFENVSIVMPLLEEFVHLIVHKDSPYEKISDLQQKNISFGPAEGGSQVTGNIFLNKFGLFFTKINKPFELSLDLLMQRKIDAVFLVSISPSPLLQDPAINQNIRLLPINTDLEDDDYQKATFDKTIYPWLTQTIDTYTTLGLLVTYDPKERYTYFITEMLNSYMAYNNSDQGIKTVWPHLVPKDRNFSIKFHMASEYLNPRTQSQTKNAIQSGSIIRLDDQN